MAKSSTRRRIDPTAGSQQFVVSEVNPNDTCGGQCACGHHPTDQAGPFIVFPAKMMPQAGRVPRAVVCAGCAKAAVLSIERGDEVSVVGAGAVYDRTFDGGEPDAPPDFKVLKARYEQAAVTPPNTPGTMPSFHDWLAAEGYTGNKPDAVVTGTATKATSLLQARADTTPVAMRGGPVHGRTDDPVAQISNPDNWGTPDDLTPVHVTPID